MPDNREKLLELFFNSPKYRHFEELLKQVPMGRRHLTKWLRKFEQESIIKRVKQKGKMPYYVQDIDNPAFRTSKRLFALEKLSDLINHLSALKKARVVILFGSFARSDWWQDSDIDIFVYGKDDGFEKGKYELKLKREIQIHKAKDAKDLQKIDKLLPYIISGDFIKGSIEDLEVDIHAKA